MFHVHFNPSPFLALPHHSPQKCRKEKPHLHIDQHTDALQCFSQAHIIRQHRTQTILAKTCQPTEARQLIWSQMLRHCLANFRGRLHGTNPPVRSYQPTKLNKGSSTCISYIFNNLLTLRAFFVNIKTQPNHQQPTQPI